MHDYSYWDAVVNWYDNTYLTARRCVGNSVQKQDVVFVIDGSGSIGPSNFQLIRESLDEVAKELIHTYPDSAVAVILFTGIARIQFDLQAYTDLDTLLEAIDQLPYYGGGTNTAEALTLLLSSAQNGELGLREDSSKVAIVVTDGWSNNHTATLSAARLLHDSNIFDIFAIGIDNANIAELHAIASGPGFVFSISSFTGIQQLQKAVLQELCTRK